MFSISSFIFEDWKNIGLSWKYFQSSQTMGNGDSKKEVDRLKEPVTSDQSVAIGSVFSSLKRIFAEGRCLIALNTPTVIADRTYTIAGDEIKGHYTITSIDAKTPDSFVIEVKVSKIEGNSIKTVKRTCTGEVFVTSLIHLRLAIRGGERDYDKETSGKPIRKESVGYDGPHSPDDVIRAVRTD